MSRCSKHWCHGDGLIFIRYQQSEGYDVAVCPCELGKYWKVKWQLKAWVAKQDPGPEYFGRLEEFFTEAELKTLTTKEGPAPCKLEAVNEHK